MRYWSFETGFGYDNLVLHEADTPRPGPRDVLLEMRAASLNYRDLVVLAASTAAASGRRSSRCPTASAS
jgi:NADPH:quinone reductase-like Zn-dependent oxidoreductase